jgi:hypothetical protein
MLTLGDVFHLECLLCLASYSCAKTGFLKNNPGASSPIDLILLRLVNLVVVGGVLFEGVPRLTVCFFFLLVLCSQLQGG